MFTPDAYIDYRAMGGIDGTFPDVKKWLAEVLPNFPAYSHLIGNFDVRGSTGDTATSRIALLQPDGARRGDGSRSCSAGSGTTTSSSAPPTAGG